ncbi:hypothetical protein BDV29DRAFT_137689 [Aspergillus leporis]|uniref:Uncharacterized protein n=1 Tax=Aspergillus leporis TaxID=41062 RepID=A0A5N5XF02_9EURO|nr:hypothetical protein BDV29DRAFT_137689 [Aspergillus leporis]
MEHSGTIMNRSARKRTVQSMYAVRTVIGGLVLIELSTALSSLYCLTDDASSIVRTLGLRQQFSAAVP